MAAYKDFTINTAASPPPWGPTEEQLWKDAIDTLVIGTVEGVKDETNGHRHHDLYDTNGVLAVDIDNTGKVSFKNGTDINEFSIDGTLAGNSDDALVTEKAIVTYVAAQITAEDLDFAGDAGTGAVDLNTQSLTIAGTANEIETSAAGQTLTVGLPSIVQIGTRLGVGVAANAANALEVAGNVRIGDAGAATNDLEVVKDQDYGTRIKVTNSHNHESAQASFLSNAAGILGLLGSYPALASITEYRSKAIVYASTTLGLFAATGEVQIYAGGTAAGNKVAVFDPTDLTLSINLQLANGTSINNIVAATAYTDTDDCIWTGANIIDYVAAQITAEDLDFSAGVGANGSIDLNSQVLAFTGTANQIITTSNGAQAITFSLPQDIHTGASPTFAGMTITNAITEFSTDGTMGDNSDSAIPTEKAVVTYVAAQITAEDLDFAGGAGTGSVDLNSQTFTIAGTANEIETSAAGQTLTIGIPSVAQIGTRLGIGVAANAANALEVAGSVRVGDAGANSYPFEIIKNSLTTSNILKVENTNAGATATAGFMAKGQIATGQFLSLPAAYSPTELSSKACLYSNKVLALFGIDAEVQIYAGGYAAGNKVGTFAYRGLDIGINHDDEARCKVVNTNNNATALAYFKAESNVALGFFGAYPTTSNYTEYRDKSVVYSSKKLALFGYDNAVELYAGGTAATNKVAIFEPSTITLNPTKADIDLIVKSDTDDYSFFVQGSGIGVCAMGTNSPNTRFYQRLDIASSGVGGMALSSFSNVGGEACLLDFNRSNNNTIGSQTLVADDNLLGSIHFRGSDGIAFRDAAMLQVKVDGTPSAGDMPGRFELSTTPDGSVTPLVRVTVLNGGSVGINVSPNTANTLEVAGKVKIGDAGAGAYDLDIIHNQDTITRVTLSNTNNHSAAESTLKISSNLAFGFLGAYPSLYALTEFRNKVTLYSDKILALFGIDNEVQVYAGGTAAGNKIATFKSTGLGINVSPNATNKFEVAGRVRIGDTGANQWELEVIKNQNSKTIVKIKNSNNNIESQAILTTESNVSSGIFGSYPTTAATVEFRDKTICYSSTKLALMSDSSDVEIYAGGHVSGDKVAVFQNTGVLINIIKSGATQAAASASANELWKTNGHATLPNNVVMIGV